ncbi:MAG: hypothetical protein KDA87_00250 [Planctomycetales bacterium]|nr:hypothetical protein [Planctomycetales bacterium]
MTPWTIRLERIGILARRLMLGRAACWFLVALVAAGSLAIGIDFALQPEDRVLRSFISLLFVASVGVAFYRLILPVIGLRPSSVEVAYWIERRFPNLGNHLTSAVAFSDCATTSVDHTSRELRQAVVANLENTVRPLPLEDALDSRPFRLSLAMLIVSLVITSIGLLAGGNKLTTGVARLSQPWRNIPWPTLNQLVFQDFPQIVAKGESVRLQVADARGHLPDEVTLIAAQEGIEHGVPKADSLRHYRMRTEDTVATYTLSRLEQTQLFKVQGGDFESPEWIRLEVRVPPKLLSFELKVSPPNYTGQPHFAWSAGSAVIAGSQLQIQGRFDQPITDCRLHWQSAPQAAQSKKIAIIKGRNFAQQPKSDWLAAESFHFWLEVKDAQGNRFHLKPRREVTVIPDTPPSISVLQPVGVVEYVSRQAKIPVEVKVEDDNRVTQLEFAYEVLAEDESVLLEDVLPIPLDQPFDANSDLSDAPGHHVHAQMKFDLADFPVELPMQKIRYRISAVDSAGQLADSQVADVVVLDDVQILQRFGEAQHQLKIDLGDLLRQQQQARQRTLQAIRSVQADKTGLATEQLQAVADLQGQIATALQGGDQAAVLRAQRLMERLQDSRLYVSDLTAELERMVSELDQISKHAIPELSLQLAMSKRWLALNQDRHKTLDSLSELGDAQDWIIQSLQSIVGDFGSLERFQEIRRRTLEFYQAERTVRQQVADFQSQHFSALVDDLDADARQVLEQLVLSQQQQRDAFQNLKRLIQLAKDSSTPTPSTNRLADQADALLAAQPLSGRLESSVQLLQNNQTMRCLTELDAILATAQALLRLFIHEPRQTASGSQNQQLQNAITDFVDRQRRLLQASQTDNSESDWQIIHSQQEQLRTDLNAWSKTWDASAVFQYTIDSAATAMSNAAQAIQQRAAINTIRQPQEQAVEWLEQMDEALTEAVRANDTVGSNMPNSIAADSENASRVRRQDLALVRSLQSNLMKKTQAAIDAGTMDQDTRQRLANTQQQLLEMVQQLMAPQSTSGTDTANPAEDNANKPNASSSVEELDQLLEDILP